jgi:hypothetical protein
VLNGLRNRGVETFIACTDNLTGFFLQMSGIPKTEIQNFIFTRIATPQICILQGIESADC